MIAQIVGEQLGGDMSKITVRTGSAEGSLGFGGFNSRQTVTAGASAHASAVVVRRKLLKVASHLLEADEKDLDVVGDSVVVKGVPELRRSFAELARAAAGLPGFQLPGIDSPGLEASEKVIINDMTYSNGSALAEVEVDEETGAVRVLRFAIAHDCGRMVNPLHGRRSSDWWSSPRTGKRAFRANDLRRHGAAYDNDFCRLFADLDCGDAAG